MGTQDIGRLFIQQVILPAWAGLPMSTEHHIGSCILPCSLWPLLCQTEPSSGHSWADRADEQDPFRVHVYRNVAQADFAIWLAAGYPFSTYGEIVACWIQDVILIVLILKFKYVATHQP